MLDMRVQAAKQALKKSSEQLQTHEDGQAKDARKPGALQGCMSLIASSFQDSRCAC